MIAKIELKIVPDEGLPESLLRSFMERAESLGITADELIAKLIRRELTPPATVPPRAEFAAQPEEVSA